MRPHKLANAPPPSPSSLLGPNRNNSFSGTLPVELGRLTALKAFTAGSNALLSGTVSIFFFAVMEGLLVAAPTG